MATMQRFNPPGNLTELSEAGRIAWSDGLFDLLNEFVVFPQFFNPLAGEDNGVAAEIENAVVWPAFPGTLLRPGGSDPERWETADGSRDNQDEYCEWGVEKSGDAIARVTFTTETPDYFEHLLRADPKLLLKLYGEFVGETPTVADLTDESGAFDPRNSFNRSENGKIAHLSQRSNHLRAAVQLLAEATVLREKDGNPVTEMRALVDCGGLGVKSRNSDPQIAIAVNRLARDGDEVSLADPPGLYIDELISTGIEAPDGADISDFWQVTRGDPDHALRARFEVPPERNYSVSDIEIDGQPIQFGAQLADRVRVRVTALARAGEHQPQPQPCKK